MDLLNLVLGAFCSRVYSMFLTLNHRSLLRHGDVFFMYNKNVLREELYFRVGIGSVHKLLPFIKITTLFYCSEIISVYSPG